MSNDDEVWELKLELAMLKDSIKNAPQLTESQILNPIPSVDQLHNFGTREEKIARISKDPAPEWNKDLKRDVRQILVVDEALANESEPEAKLMYEQPHQVGRFKLTPKLETPAGFISAPKGVSIETIKDEWPAAYNYLKMKKVEHF